MARPRKDENEVKKVRSFRYSDEQMKKIDFVLQQLNEQRKKIAEQHNMEFVPYDRSSLLISLVTDKERELLSCL